VREFDCGRQRSCPLRARLSSSHGASPWIVVARLNHCLVGTPNTLRGLGPFSSVRFRPPGALTPGGSPRPYGTTYGWWKQGSNPQVLALAWPQAKHARRRKRGAKCTDVHRTPWCFEGPSPRCTKTLCTPSPFPGSLPPTVLFLISRWLLRVNKFIDGSVSVTSSGLGNLRSLGRGVPPTVAEGFPHHGRPPCSSAALSRRSSS
jgi:hypothetical protein